MANNKFDIESLGITGAPSSAQLSTGDTPLDNLYGSILHDTWMGQAYMDYKARQRIIDEFGAIADDPLYNPFTDPANADYLDHVLESRSEAESALIREKVDWNTSGKAELDANGAGVIRFLSQFFDPLTWAPVPAAKGLGFLAGAKKATPYAAGSIAASEGVRYELDPTMTGEELALSLTAGTILSAALAGGVSALGKRAYSAGPDAVEMERKVDVMSGQDEFVGPVPQTKPTQKPDPIIGEDEEFGVDIFPDAKKVDIRVQKIDETVTGKRPGGAYPKAFRRVDGSGKETIFLDKEAIEASFAQKPWLHPKMEGVRPLNRDFQTPGEWVRFVLAHEKAHVKAGKRKPNESQPDYENRMNEMALVELDRAASIRRGDAPKHITNAKAKAEQSLINNKIEIDELKASVRSLGEKIEAIKAKLGSNKSNAGGRITKANKKIAALELERDMAQANIEILGEQRARIQGEVDSAKRKFDEFDQLPEQDALAFSSAMGLDKISVSELPFYRLINTKLRTLAPLLAGKWMKLAYQIAGSPGLINEGAKVGIAPPESVEMLSKQWFNLQREAMQATERHYMEYAKGIKGATQGQVTLEKAKQVGQRAKEFVMRQERPQTGVMTLSEFRKAVGLQMMNNDAKSGNHFVDKAVGEWRKVFDQFESAGHEVGIFATVKQAEKNIEYWRGRIFKLEEGAKEYAGLGIAKWRIDAIEKARVSLDEAEQQLELLKLGKDLPRKKYFHIIWRKDAIDANEQEFLELLRAEFRRNPKTSVHGEVIDLSKKPLSLEVRVQEAFANIHIQAVWQDSLGLLNKMNKKERIHARISQLRKDIATHSNMELIPEGLDGRKVKELQIEALKKDLKRLSKGEDATPAPGMALGRKMQINHSNFSKFIEHDIDAVGQHYVARMAPAIEMSRKFGDMRIDKYLDELNAEVMREAGLKPGRAKEILEEGIALRQAAEDLRDKVLGVYGIPDDPSALTPRTLYALKAWNTLALMGKAWMAALIDTGRIVMSEGFVRTFKGMAHYFAQIPRGPSGEFRIAGREVEMAGEAMDIVNATRLRSMTDLGGSMYGLSKFERGLTSATGPFFLLNLLSVWTDNAKRFAGSMIQSRMIEDSIALSKGKLEPERARRLAAIGLDKEMAGRFVAQWEASGSTKGDHLFLANTTEWADQGAAKSFRAMLAQEVNTAVITPHAADKFNFMSKPWGSVLMQYRGFGMSATQRVMMAGIQQKDKSALIGVASMITLAAMVDNERRPDYVELEFDELIFRAVETSGVTGIFADINSALEIASGQQYGLRPMLGLDPVIKDANWAQRTGAPLGAVGSQWLQFMYALTPEADGSDVARGIRYMLPYQNLWFWSDSWGRAQRSLAEMIEE